MITMRNFPSVPQIGKSATLRPDLPICEWGAEEGALRQLIYIYSYQLLYISLIIIYGSITLKNIHLLMYDIEERIHALWAKGGARSLDESMELGRLLTDLQPETPPGNFSTHIWRSFIFPHVSRSASYASTASPRGSVLI